MGRPVLILVCPACVEELSAAGDPSDEAGVHTCADEHFGSRWGKGKSSAPPPRLRRALEQREATPRPRRCRAAVEFPLVL